MKKGKSIQVANSNDLPIQFKLRKILSKLYFNNAGHKNVDLLVLWICVKTSTWWNAEKRMKDLPNSHHSADPFVCFICTLISRVISRLLWANITHALRVKQCSALSIIISASNFICCCFYLKYWVTKEQNNDSMKWMWSNHSLYKLQA
jgi:hypothetical protein